MRRGLRRLVLTSAVIVAITAVLVILAFLFGPGRGMDGAPNVLDVGQNALRESLEFVGKCGDCAADARYPPGAHRLAGHGSDVAVSSGRTVSSQGTIELPALWYRGTT